MDPEYYEIAIYGITGAAFVLCFNAYFKYRYLEQKSSDDTYKDHVDAEIRKMNKTQELVNNDGYKKYLEQRIDVLNELNLSSNTPSTVIKSKIDAVVEPYSFEEKEI
ncbi:hypothetical protein GQ472_02405 [archaeon]|nr:hypothetical protein [archaeon]